MKINVEEIKKLCDPAKDQKILVDDLIIEKGAINQLPQVLNEKYAQYKNIVMICDENTYKAAGQTVERLVPNIKTIILDPADLHADEHGVALAEDGLKKYENIDFMIACGSGTVHDITRFHAYKMNIDFLSIPTAASVDGFVSTMAAMTWHGMKKTFTAVSPVYVLADSEIFSKAPTRLTASGVGDLLGKYTALCDWRISSAVTGEYISWPIVNWEYEILQDLVNNLEGIDSGDLLAYENLMYGLLLSGLAMQIITYSRPASGCEHHCSHFWEEEVINETIDYLHGEKVGVGLCITSAVYKKALKKIKEGKYTLKDHMDVEVDLITKYFKNPVLQEEILKENELNVMENITGSMIKEHEPDIIKILEELPSAEQEIKWLKQVHGVTTLSEIGLDENLRTLTLKLSPYVRKRLTFMRLLKFYSFYDEIIA